MPASVSAISPNLETGTRRSAKRRRRDASAFFLLPGTAVIGCKAPRHARWLVMGRQSPPIRAVHSFDHVGYRRNSGRAGQAIGTAAFDPERLFAMGASCGAGTYSLSRF